MKAIIAEKPSVAREIAKVLNVYTETDGYLRGNGYCITWALGHLVQLAMPEEYAQGNNEKVTLPFVPEPFLLKIKTKSEGKRKISDPLAKSQISIIQKVFHQCSSIIVATDAGREGELIFRYIYDYLQCRLPFERLWISSLTENAIVDGLKKLRPGQQLKGLYQAGKSRSEADWLIGINASRALSQYEKGDIYSLGRVQTPLMALICKRYLLNRNHISSKHWKIQIRHRKDYTDFHMQSVDEWTDQKSAERVLHSLMRKGDSEFIAVDKNEIKEKAPLLFDLTSLQKEANIKLGMTAQETLQAAQSLYEKKLITYPRTGSRYIPEDVWKTVPDLVRGLSDMNRFRNAVSQLKFGNFNKSMVDNLKITDHHALLTTGRQPVSVTSAEQSIYDLIGFRLLEALSELCIKERCTVISKVLHFEFKTVAVQILSMGWRGIKGILSESETDSEKNSLIELPVLSVGDSLKISDAVLLEKVSKPPKLYTEADLLGAMELAGQKLEEADQRKILSGIGIGTPATRASIIESLLKRKYVERIKKHFHPTEKGMAVFNLVKDHTIADVEMTANWELGLHEVESGRMTSQDFMNGIVQLTKDMVAEFQSKPVLQKSIPDLNCPKCKARTLSPDRNALQCPDEQCRWKQFRNVCGVQLDWQAIQSLIIHGRTPLIKGMKSQSGKTFDACIVMQVDATTVFEFPKRPEREKR